MQAKHDHPYRRGSKIEPQLFLLDLGPTCLQCCALPPPPPPASNFLSVDLFIYPAPAPAPVLVDWKSFQCATPLPAAPSFSIFHDMTFTPPKDTTPRFLRLDLFSGQNSTNASTEF